MRLFNITSWRTFVVAVATGYTIAWGIHWATTFYSLGTPIHDNLILLTPWSR